MYTLSKIPRLHRLLYSGAAALGLIWAAVAFGDLSVSVFRERRFSEREQLLSMYRPIRPTEGRLIGMIYAPYVGPSSEGKERLLRLGRTKVRALSGETGSALPRDVALISLLAGNPGAAIATLERANQGVGLDAVLFNDLSVAYLERARDQDQVEDLVAAVAAASRAARDHDVPLEAIFNKALCLQKLSMWRGASDAWRRYLDQDHNSSWADEARRFLKPLFRMTRNKDWEEARQILFAGALAGDVSTMGLIVDRFPQSAREHAEEQLLGAWGEAWEKGDYREAGRSLIVARQIGGTLTKSRGDRMLQATVSVIDRAASNGQSSERLFHLARGQRLYRDGLAELNKANFARASELLRESENLLSNGGSPFALWAKLRIAVCNLQRFRYAQAYIALSNLAIEARRKEYRSLEAAAFWSMGLIHGIQARPVEAISKYRYAANLFAVLGELENLAVVNSLIASSFRDLGDDVAAWRSETTALKMLQHVREPRKRVLILDEARALFQNSSTPDRALPFQDEVLAEGGAARQTILLITGFRQKAMLCSELGLSSEALQAVGSAKKLLKDVPDEGARASLLGDLLVIEGHVIVSNNPKAAIEVLTPALHIYSKTAYTYQLAWLYFERARAYMAIGRLESAEADLLEAIEAIELQRRDISDLILQYQFLDQARKIYYGMANLQLQLGRPRVALGWLESLKASTLLFSDTVSPSPFELVGRAQAALQADQVIIEFAILDRSLWIWLLRHNSLRVFKLSGDIRDLEREGDDLHRAVGKLANGELFRSHAGVLAQRLIAPILSELRPGERLIFVPDGFLHSIPYAALWNSKRKKFLIEDFQVSIAPSAAMYALSINNSRRMHGNFNSVAALGDPTFDRRLWPRIRALPGARKEVQEVASLYPRAKTLIGPEATTGAFWGLTRSYDVIHVASHGIINPEQPLLSSIILAPSSTEGTSGTLYARDLYRQSYATTRLIVLSACTTLGERFRGSEGLSSLARPFLSGGVPAVVGTLWPVEDSGEHVFSISFHRWLRKTEDPSVALRLAQIDALSDSTSSAFSPSVWAAFQLLGS